MLNNTRLSNLDYQKNNHPKKEALCFTSAFLYHKKIPQDENPKQPLIGIAKKLMHICLSMCCTAGKNIILLGYFVMSSFKRAIIL